MFNLFGQTKNDLALKCWEKGDITGAHHNTVEWLIKDPGNDQARFLMMKILFVQGKYTEALHEFNYIKKSFRHYKQCVELAADAYVHKQEYNLAIDLAEKYKLLPASLLNERRTKPFTVIADKTYTVPFLQDTVLPSHFLPCVNGSINGIACPIRFDTGGNYLVIGTKAASRLSISLTHKHTNLHNVSRVTSYYSIADSMKFDNGPSFRNVPVLIMESLDDFIIFGTNILEPFLTTIDYPGDRFIFTPRNNSILINEHYQSHSGLQKTPFYLWSDHFMMAKGSFDTQDTLLLFFDSGLVFLTEKNGKTIQASFTASKEALLRWGFEKSDLKQSKFLFTNKSLEASGLSQPNTVVWYDTKLKKDRNFGGIRIDGLISHAWLKNYSWTIDFDKMEYCFGETKVF